MTDPMFQVGYLERLPLETTHPAVVGHVRRVLEKLPEKTEIVIDHTGVGRPVFDMFLAAGLSPIGVVITAGTAETHDNRVYGVPKLTLISRVQAMLHQGTQKILRDLPEAEALVRELQDYRVEFTAAGHLTFNARVGRHDDLVLALAISCWRAHGSGAGSGIYGFYRDAYYAQGGPELVEPDRYTIGVDLGQSRDPTAICVVRRRPANAAKASATDALVDRDDDPRPQ
jgi:hypothetical protein